jgi:DNA-binding PadR family transcriptional regulator
MSIKHAILGFLSWQSFSGYDLKKMFADSNILYWSGNNNQIYKTLLQLNEEGLVTQHIQYQESLPAKKIYSITPKGLQELKQWLLSTPEPSEFQKSFLIQLSWAEQLSAEELLRLLDMYEEQVHMQLLMQKEKIRRGENSPKRSEREVFVWEMINQNSVSFYESELAWLYKLRTGLKLK